MPGGVQVHWHEGLFLQPHHIQLLQRQVLEQSFGERRLQSSYPYGIIDARLNAEALETMLVRFEHLRAVMPSGLEVNFPETADMPALNIEQAFNDTPESLMICLAVPLWHSTRPNSVSVESNGQYDWRYKQIYRVAEVTRADENTGQNPVPIQVRRINARLVIDRPGEDLSDVELLPVLRIAHTATDEGQGLPRRDPSFVAPAFLITGAPQLYERFRELINLLDTRRRELVDLIKRMQFTADTMQANQIHFVMRLRIYNYYAGRLPSLFKAPAVTPLTWYLELRGMLGDLTALRPELPELFDSSAYDHDNLMRPFDELLKKISNLLAGQKPKTATVYFVREGRYLVADVKEEHFKLPNDYFLAIRTQQDPATLAPLVENGSRFKLMPKNDIGSEIYGMALEYEKYPPLELPSQAGLNYFRLNRKDSGRVWDKMRAQRAMAMKWPGMETSDFFLTEKRVVLMMTIPEGAEVPT